MMKKFKAVVVGCGSRGVFHIEAYKYIKEANVTACFSPTPEKRQSVGSEYGLKVYSNLYDMLSMEMPDIVHIATPPQPRVELMKIVSEMKVPLCTVEKPVAIGVSDWKALVELEKRTETKFAVCHQFRWQKYLLKCKRAIERGNLGKVKFIEMSAGMNSTGQGTHILNYGRFLAGDPEIEMVFGNIYGWDISDPYHPGSEAAEAYFIFSNGVRGVWTTGNISPRCSASKTVWKHVRIIAYTDKGHVKFEEFGRWEIVGGSLDESGDFGGMEQWKENNLQAQAAFHRSMFNWLKTGISPGTSLKDSLMEWKSILAVYQSALEGRPIRLSKFNPSEDLIERIIRKFQ
ncbi:Gfo/Idh/MocA family oxidoreductase [bacterium]|nr:Gfo/Idh/MocA family oxidoreductase [bacterium]